MQSGDYEFSQNENELIKKTALWAKVLGGVLIVEGAFKLVDIGENPVGTLISIGLAIAIGLAFIRGGSGLSKVVDTEGNDVLHLMEGLTQLTRAFTIRIVLMVIALVFMGLGILVVGLMSL